MRCVQWAVATLVAGLMIQHAQGIELAYRGHTMGTSNQRASLCAPACACPSYGALSPGCCRCQPNCCSHVWDGYCQEQAERCCWGGWCVFPWPFCSSTKVESVVVSDCGSCSEASGNGDVIETQPSAPMPTVKPLPKPPKPEGVSWVTP